MSFSREIQVLIIGAGIGGLSLAGFFRQAGIQPVVIQSQEDFAQQGYVIELWPKAMALLDRLDAGEAVRDTGTVITSWRQRFPDGSIVEELETDTPGGFVAIRDGSMREELIEHIGSDAIRMGVALRSLEASERPVTVTFENGVREKFDLVIGADGANSRTREVIGGPRAVKVGTSTCLFPIPSRTDLSGANEIWTSSGMVFRAVSTGECPVGLLTVQRDAMGNGKVDPGTINKAGAEIEWVLPEVGEQLTADDILAVHDYKVPPDIWAEGRVALIGDAAHARHPLAGVGPTRAIKDAAVLVSELLSREDSLSARLAEYACLRHSAVTEFPNKQTEGSAKPLSSVEDPVASEQGKIRDIRGNTLANAFNSEISEPVVNPLPSQG